MTTEYWEQWLSCTTPPRYVRKKHTTVDVRDGITWITYPDEIRGQHVTVEMPTNAPTKNCDTGEHDRCTHGLGQRHEGGVWFWLRNHRGVLWRCGCPCHKTPRTSAASSKHQPHQLMPVPA